MQDLKISRHYQKWLNTEACHCFLTPVVHARQVYKHFVMSQILLICPASWNQCRENWRCQLRWCHTVQFDWDCNRLIWFRSTGWCVKQPPSLSPLQGGASWPTWSWRSLCVVSRTERRSRFPHRHAEGLQQLRQLPAEEVTAAHVYLTSLVLGGTFTLDDQIRLFWLWLLACCFLEEAWPAWAQPSIVLY